ncbi:MULTISPECIES: hypothetical protein [unclassified Gemella]|uniref:hypothetical protein n=1 Tax=unclassified Gemella TaxID=2624949 RepID=UPI001C05E823|nr:MULTISPECIES: hypothetical protein [unclassified Gemella]MBU0279347.1 hypothetical protein [Gemella sp. zg-1178]QWQ39300.1 hypothetical protein KMP11_02955 [Gemella sp. zg-570]
MNNYKDYIQLKDVLNFRHWRVMRQDRILEFIEEEREKFFKSLDCEPTRKNLLKLCPLVQGDAYVLGFLVSKAYSPEEIEEKKRYYLSLEPLPEANVPIGLWKYKVERTFRGASFNDYPDWHFCCLDTYRKLGRFYF